MRYADLHCDALTAAAPGTSFLHRTTSQVSLEKLVGGDCLLQCFALFTPPAQDFARAEAVKTAGKRSATGDGRARNSRLQAEPPGGAGTGAEKSGAGGPEEKIPGKEKTEERGEMGAESPVWRRAQRCLSAFWAAEGELSAAGIRPVLTVENGGVLEGELPRLDALEKAGVKLFGFTWNEENELGFPCGRSGGLKPFGKRVAEELLSRGIYPDVSHLSDEGFFEVAEIASAFRIPFAASHSLARSVCPHRRNLTDAQIRAVADSGGLIGVNFVREFIGEAGIFAHVVHLWKTGGEDVLAVGSDFDGTDRPLYAGADEMPRFFEDLARAGLPASVLEKLAFRNALRLLS